MKNEEKNFHLLFFHKDLRENGRKCNKIIINLIKL